MDTFVVGVWIYWYIGIQYALMGGFGLYFLYKSRFKIGFLAVFYRKSVGGHVDADNTNVGSYTFVFKDDVPKDRFVDFVARFPAIGHWLVAGEKPEFKAVMEGQPVGVIKNGNVVGGNQEYVYVDVWVSLNPTFSYVYYMNPHQLGMSEVGWSGDFNASLLQGATFNYGAEVFYNQLLESNGTYEVRYGNVMRQSVNWIDSLDIWLHDVTGIPDTAHFTAVMGDVDDLSVATSGNVVNGRFNFTWSVPTSSYLTVCQFVVVRLTLSGHIYDVVHLFNYCKDNNGDNIPDEWATGGGGSPTFTPVPSNDGLNPVPTSSPDYISFIVLFCVVGLPSVVLSMAGAKHGWGLQGLLFGLIIGLGIGVTTGLVPFWTVFVISLFGVIFLYGLAKKG